MVLITAGIQDIGVARQGLPLPGSLHPDAGP